ncbi:MAG: PIN domain-containing protein [Terracidiphilus sp.]
MGLILDSSIVIAAERKCHTVREILQQFKALHGEVEIGLSVVTIAEMMHGAYRAQHEARKLRRLSFIDRLCQDIPVYPVTVEIARIVGRIEGQQAALGFTLAFEDLAIGVTAMQLGFELITTNLKHFQQIPGLKIMQPK